MPFLNTPFEPRRIQNKTKYIWNNPKLNVELTRSREDSAELFSKLKTDNDVANFLEIPVGQLLYILYELKSKYSSFEIPKKRGGKRKIDKPCPSLMILQQKIKPFIENVYRVKKPVHGFVSQEVLSKKTKMPILKGIK